MLVSDAGAGDASKVKRSQKAHVVDHQQTKLGRLGKIFAKDLPPTSSLSDITHVSLAILPSDTAVTICREASLL